MTVRFRINDAEYQLLKDSHVSHQARLVYLLGVRPFMDFKTGITGKVRRISYQGLHEVLEFIPEPGSQREKVDLSVKALRCLIDELERAGLVKRLPNDARALVLECLVADREDAAKNRKGRGGADLKASNGKDFTVSDGGRKGIPPVSGKPIGIPKAAALLTDPVDNFAAMRFNEIVLWLKAAEKRRGKIVSVQVGDEHIKSFVCSGVSTETLSEAHALAVADRAKQNNPAPISSGFLRVFVEKLSGKNKQWFETWSGIERKAGEIGFVQMPNESNWDFKCRVFAAVCITDHEARKCR